MKTLLYLIQPLGIVWLLLLGWLLFQAWRRRWRTAAVPGLAWFILTLVTCTPAVSFLAFAIEEEHPPVAIADLAQADAIIYLGGGASPSLTEPTGLHLKSGADRLSTALVLLLQNKAPVLVLGGGSYLERGRAYSEADYVCDILTRTGLPARSIVSLGNCADTHDEAIKVTALARERGWKKILLVTSALHMPRTTRVFTKAGAPEFQAVPCNYLSGLNHIGDLDWLHLPHPGAISTFGAWLHEEIGLLYYRWLGRI